MLKYGENSPVSEHLPVMPIASPPSLQTWTSPAVSPQLLQYKRPQLSLLITTPGRIWVATSAGINCIYGDVSVNKTVLDSFKT